MTVMTSTDVYEQLRVSYREMLQNACLYAAIYGEVGVFEGLPFYRSSVSLFVVGYELERSSAPIERRFQRLVRNVAREATHLTTIEYWGPSLNFSDRLGAEVICTSRQAPDLDNCDVILDLRGISSTQVNSLRCVRRARGTNLESRENRGKETTQEHSKLVANFLRRKRDANLTADDVKYIRAWKEVLADEHSNLIEVYDGSCLTGFSIISAFGRNMPTYAYGFFDNGRSGTSDLAHAAMIEFCLDRGYAKLDLGYSINANLLRYKMKWGPIELVEPPCNVRWSVVQDVGAPLHDTTGVNLSLASQARGLETKRRPAVVVGISGPMSSVVRDGD